MTDLLDLEPGDRVLEVGTGSGYQGAVLAEITDHVYSIEIIPSLAAEVAAKLERLGYGDIHLRLGDGYFGWEEEAPFDGIIVTAAPDHVPPPLLQQLADGGRMVIPVGPAGRRPDPMAHRAQGRRVRQDQPGRSEVRPLHQGAPLRGCSTPGMGSRPRLLEGRLCAGTTEWGDWVCVTDALHGPTGGATLLKANERYPCSATLGRLRRLPGMPRRRPVSPR